jgi:hypothetical protein
VNMVKEDLDYFCCEDWAPLLVMIILNIHQLFVFPTSGQISK